MTSTVTCPSCGKATPGGFPRCAHCGSELAAAPAPAREERKVVTVLFCDLVGFTSRAEQLDPEDVRAVLGPYHARLRSELERYGGTVEKFIGDAVMAVFGAPVAHEDDPERAVRAALAIREGVTGDDELQVRIGITTGEALVNLAARPASGEGMASGDVVNTAARLESNAPVDGILVDETTFRATERAIDYRQAEAVAAKGKAEPVPVWEAVQARARLGVDVRQVGATPLVGRGRELRLLTESLTRAEEERSPQLLTLVGVPGIGKSRLVYELYRWADARPRLVSWRQGRSLPYGEGVSFWALSEIVKAQAGILESDSTETAREKLGRSLEELVEDESERSWIEGHLRPLVGVERHASAGEGDRPEMLAAWRLFVEALAAVRPLVLVFEDLHFADDGLLDFIDHLVEWASGVPLLVLCTARPELLARRSQWGGGKVNAATISLSPLSDSETGRLVHALLERSVLPAQLQARLLEQAGGNPLYAEEFARLARERGDDAALPESVQGIVAARLDSLPADHKATLQDAAVIGKVFWAGAVAAMQGRERAAVERELHELERREFVRRERRPSVSGELEYAFRHLLVRDVAYGQVPRAGRAARHEAAARWIESLASDRSDDRAEMLAHHYLAAVEFAEAAGQDTAGLARAARPALRDAADRALTLNAFPVAARFYREALRLVPADDRERPQLLFRLGRALAPGDPSSAETVLAEAAAALADAGDVEAAAEAEALLAELWWYRGQRDRVFEHLERARARIRHRGPSAAKAHVLAAAARYLMLAGRLGEAIDVGEEALTLARDFALDGLRANVLTTVGTARVLLGDEDGPSDIEDSIEIALAVNSPEAARGYNNLAVATWLLGDLTRAASMYEESGRIAQRFGNLAFLRFSRINRAAYLHATGDWDGAIGVANQFVAEVEAGSPHYQESAARDLRAAIRFARGELHGLVEDLERSLRAARETEDPQSVLPTVAHLLRTLTELGRLEEARPLADELLASPSEQLVLPAVCGGLGWTAAELGRAAEAAAFLEAAPASRWTRVGLALLAGDFEQAAEDLAEIGLRTDEALARLRAAGRLVAEGRRTEADRQLHRALAFWRSVGATRYVREGERLLAASA